MNSEFSPPLPGQSRTGRSRALAACLMAMMLAVATPAFATGGDPMAPFPATDPLPSRQEATATASDSAGNIIVAGYTSINGMNNDYQVTRFKADGSGVDWHATFDKSGGDDRVTAVVVDGSDNVIVTGTVWNGSNLDIQTIKYAPDGTLLWQHTWSGTGGNDIATSIAVDAGGNIYVAGYSANGSGNDDFLLLKYPAAGDTPSWEKTWNSEYDSNDRIMSIAAGSDGIAVTGASSKGGTDFDILSRKFGFDGSLTWEQRKGSNSSGDDRGVAVKMDDFGNVIVSGYIYNGLNNDIYTVKYAAASPGSPAWEKTTTLTGNDEPRAIWLDSDGDVYVTGHAYTYSGNEDIYTVRYRSSDGQKVWDALYNSGSDFTDIPLGIMGRAGSDGGLFVTGYTVTSINENITTLKYGKNSGTLLWQTSYNGSANRDDRPAGISLDPAGNVLVAGWSDSATSYDFIVLKYDFGPLDPPTALTAVAASNTEIALSWQDNSSNEEGFRIERKQGETGSYGQAGTVGPGVTTFSDPGLAANSYYYYRVLAYNSADGDSAASNEAHALTKVVSYAPPEWIFRYNGDDNREDEAVAVVTGADDHPVITGFSDLTEEGVEDAYSFDYLTFKLNRADSSIIWKARYDSGDGGTDMAAGVVLDNNGDAIITGTAYLSGGDDKSDDLFTIKYSSAGHSDPESNPPFAWGEQYGTQAGIDQATAIQAVRDSENSVVVIGHGYNTANDEDMFVIKYRSDGTTPWPPIVHDGGTGGNDYPSAVALDPSGDIFITGSTENASGDFDIYTAKYSGASGSLIWSQTFAGAGEWDDHGLSLAVDQKGDVYVTGYAVNAAGNEEWVTVKYAGAQSAPQRELWQKSWNGPATPVNGNDRGISVVVDPVDGAVVVAGTSYLTETDSDFHLVRYAAADGEIIWERNFDRPESYDYVTAMSVDSSGYIYLTGNSRSGPDTDTAHDVSSNILALIYDFEGTFLGATTHDGGLLDEARAIATNFQGEAFIAGVTRNAANPDYLLLKQQNSYILVPAPLKPMPQADSGRISVTWRSNTPGTGFRLERTLGPVLPTSSWTLLTDAAPGTTGFADSGLTPGTNYCYRIYAYTGSLNSRTIESCVTTTLGATILSPPTVDSTSQITLAWSQVAGNSGYRIERKTGSGAWSELAVKAADATTHIDSGLTAGTLYTYRVSTLSGSGASLPSSELGATTIPAAPSMTALGSITSASATINWSNVSGETGFRIERKEGSGGAWSELTTRPADILTYTDSGLAANTQYYYRVRAYNAFGNSAYSAEQGVLTRFTSTAITSAAGADTNNIDLAWDNVPGNTGYVVQYVGCSQNNPSNAATYCTNTAYYSTSWTTLTTLAADVTTYRATGLTAGYAYRYRIVANTNGNSSDPSTPVIAWTKMAPPAVTITPASETALTVNWIDIAGETNYTLERKQGAAGTWAEVSGATGMAANTVTKTDSGLALSTEYCYRVKAYSSNTNGPPESYSNEPCLTTPLAAPVLDAPAGITASQVDLSWNNVTGNTGYEVERCQFSQLDTPQNASSYLANDSYWNSCATIATLPADTMTYLSSGLTAGYTYRYRVRDTYSGGISAWSNPQPVTTVPPTPAINSLTAVSTSQINIGFTNGYGETGYNMEWKQRSGADCTTGTWNGPIAIGQNQTTYGHTGLATATWYCYRLTAINGAGASGYSSEPGQTTLAAAPVLSSPTGITTSQAVLSWSSIAGNTGYKIERKTGASGSWAAIYTTATDATGYTNSGLAAGTLYYWRVSTNNAGGSSAPSNEQPATTTPVPPSVIATIASAEQIDLAWPLVRGASEYRIERKEASGSYGEIGTTVAGYVESYCGNSYQSIGCTTLTPETATASDSGLAADTTYCYRLRSWNATGGDSAYSTEKCGTTLSIPSQTVTATAINSFKIRLDWSPLVCTPTPCAQPEGYELERLVRDGNWVKIATTNGDTTTFTDRIAIDPLKQYRYRIRSYSGSFRSPYAEAATYTPPYRQGDNVGP